MEATLQDFLAGSVFAFILTFVRVGTAVMIMPGIGDSFVSTKIRLHFALGLSFVLFPFLKTYMPASVPGTVELFPLIIYEFIIGLFFGTVTRIFMTAMDTAGQVVSVQSGLGSAQLFNPSLATQGSLMGAFLSVTGVMVLFVTDMHHLLLTGLVESYNYFPVGNLPEAGGMAEIMTRSVSSAFAIGIRISAPFMVLSLLIYVGMGALSRVMPQMQVFIISLPLQILLSVMLLMLCLSAMFVYWLQEFQEGMRFFFEAVE